MTSILSTQKFLVNGAGRESVKRPPNGGAGVDYDHTIGIVYRRHEIVEQYRRMMRIGRGEEVFGPPPLGTSVPIPKFVGIRGNVDTNFGIKGTLATICF